MAEIALKKTERHDSINQERFTCFKKEEFEVDWEKVSESKFSCVYQVKLKLWREKCAIKTFTTTSDYRYSCTVTKITLRPANVFLFKQIQFSFNCLTHVTDHIATMRLYRNFFFNLQIIFTPQCIILNVERNLRAFLWLDPELQVTTPTCVWIRLCHVIYFFQEHVTGFQNRKD